MILDSQLVSSSLRRATAKTLVLELMYLTQTRAGEPLAIGREGVRQKRKDGNGPEDDGRVIKRRARDGKFDRREEDARQVEVPHERHERQRPRPTTQRPPSMLELVRRDEDAPEADKCVRHDGRHPSRAYQ